MASPEGDRVLAVSRQLAQAHQELHRRIGAIKSDLGQRRLDDGELSMHCIAFCAALTVHHQGEDTGMFTELVRERPDLAGTVGKLREDHGLISSILSRVRELADQAADCAGLPAQAVRSELEGLTAIMESHFRYEERAIGEALDGGVSGEGWSRAVFRFESG